MKGSLSVDPVFATLNIKKAVVHLLNPVVASDSHRLYLGSKSIPWDSVERSIINCTFSEEYKVLLLLCDDWKLHVFNQNLEKIAILHNWQSKYTVGFDLLENIGALLLVGVSQVELLKMTVNTNIKRTKFLSSVTFSIEKKKKLSVDPKTKLKWNKGYGYDLKSNLLFLWSLQDINFYVLSNLELKSSLKKVVRKEQPITFVYFSASYHYTLTGLINGSLKVWRLPLHQSSLSQENQVQDYILIHNCLHHSKAVEKIVGTKDDRVIFSQGSDLAVCMWSLQTFQLLRVYDFEEQYSKVILNDSRGGLAVRDHYLGHLIFGKTMQYITDLTSPIVTHNKTFSKVGGLMGEIQENKVLETQFTLGSNIALQVSNEDLQQQNDLNKLTVKHFYPPLGSQEIRQVIASPFIQNCYYLLTETGRIYRVRMQGAASMIEHYYNVNLTHDIENHPLGQMPTLIKFLQYMPVEFDSEIVESAIVDRTTQEKEKEENLQQKFQRLKLITIGCSKGSIIFLPTDNMDHIYTRVTYHRSQILCLETVRTPNLSNSCLLSICSQFHLKFVSFHHDKAHCFRTIQLNKPSFSFMRGFLDQVAVVLKGGSFQLFQFDQQHNLGFIQNYDSIDHEGDILALDWDEGRKIVLTAGSDNKIKIWSYHKVQLYEITLDQGLKYAVFSNQCEILVSHQGKLLYLRGIDFKVTREEVATIQAEFLESNEHQVMGLEDFLSKVNSTKQHVSKPKQNIDIHQEYEKITHQIHDKLTDGNAKIKANKSIGTDKYNSGKQDIFKKETALLSHFPISARESKKSGKHYYQHRPRQLSSREVYSSKNKQNKQKRTRSTVRKEKKQSLKWEQNGFSLLDVTDLINTKKHLEELQLLKKEVNGPILPKIKPKQKDIFDDFMQQKLLEKKVLTRRDITLNRIIMKNIVKENIGGQTEALTGLKFEL